jgi:hypothetical protein
MSNERVVERLAEYISDDWHRLVLPMIELGRRMLVAELQARLQTPVHQTLRVLCDDLRVLVWLNDGECVTWNPEKLRALGMPREAATVEQKAMRMSLAESLHAGRREDQRLADETMLRTWNRLPNMPRV